MFGVIGGTGLGRIDGLELIQEHAVDTPFGAPSAPLLEGRLDGVPVIFLARHGRPHRIAPHEINYRANLWALRRIGVDRIVAVAAVGGIRDDLGPEQIAIPHQILDYTYGRAHTFWDGETFTHVDFTEPYDEGLRRALLDAASRAGIRVCSDGVYAATQGPRLESAAEIARLDRDGAHMVGMTGMPEAGLARELGLPYATCAVVANWAAGRGDGPISEQAIANHLANAMSNVRRLLGEMLQAMHPQD